MNGPVKNRRWFPLRLQFSLRMLMLWLTAFAIGFPIWYRWPYQVVVSEMNPATGSVVARRAVTMQRQWGSPALRHGQERFEAGPLVAVTNYVRGKKEGPYHSQNHKTKNSETGQYRNDMKEGTWIHHYYSQVITWNWHEGKSHGECIFTGSPSQRMELKFDNGRLMRFNGKPVHDRIFDHLTRGEVDRRTAAALEADTILEVAEMPLNDIALYLAEMHDIPVIIDADAGVDVNRPISHMLRGLPLSSVLMILEYRNDLACDYRYGMLWITTPEDADDWHDPTGVAEIVPPKDSPLARAWNEPVAVEALHMPLDAVLGKITQRLAIDIDVSQVRPTSEEPLPLTFTGSIRDLPFRHALGYLLYKTSCRCLLEDGQLTVQPQSAGQAKASSGGP